MVLTRGEFCRHIPCSPRAWHSSHLLGTHHIEEEDRSQILEELGWVFSLVISYMSEYLSAILECLGLVTTSGSQLWLHAQADPGRQQVMAQVFKFLPFMWDASKRFLNSWYQLPTPCCCRYLGCETTDGRSVEFKAIF